MSRTNWKKQYEALKEAVQEQSNDLVRARKALSEIVALGDNIPEKSRDHANIGRLAKGIARTFFHPRCKECGRDL
jgi:hypothetical protein